jgi:hypothetical protein
MNRPIIGTRQIVWCYSVGSEVVAEYTGESDYDGWLHLHNDSVEEDEIDVEAFKARMYEEQVGIL